MKTTEQKAQFVELRAQGQSFRQIAEALHISKSTCSAWQAELEDEIAEREQERLEELYSAYNMTKQHRITRIGEQLNRIDAALAQKDLTELPADKLLELKLKYQRELKTEYAQPTTPIEETSLEAILLQYMTIAEKTESGEISAAQSKAQLAAVKEAHLTMKAIEQRDNPFCFNPQL